MPTRKVTEPTTEALTVEDVKAGPGLRVTHAADDALIAAFITAARHECEQAIGRSILATTWELAADDFGTGVLRLEWPTVRAIASVKYINQAGVETTLPGTEYVLDSDTHPAYLRAAYGATLPTPRLEANAVRVRYVAGFDTGAEVDAAARRAAVPASLRAWMQLRVEQLYNGCAAEHGPAMAAHPLLSQWKEWR